MSLEFNSTTPEDMPRNGPEMALEAVEAVPSDAHIKRKRGALPGNVNALKHGAFTKDIERARRRKLRGSAKRREIETLAAVLRDQGDLDSVPMTLQFLCRRFARVVGRIYNLDKAEDRLLRQHPELRRNGPALVKLYDSRRSLEADALALARTIGFARRTGTEGATDVLNEIAAERERGHKPEETDEG